MATESIREWRDRRTMIVIICALLLLLTKACDFTRRESGETIRVDGKKYEVVKRTVDTVYKTVTKVVYREGKTIHRELKVYNVVPLDTNLDSIAREYFATTTYKDTLHLGKEIGYIAVTDTVTSNAIKGRLWSANVKQKTVTETVVVKEPAKVQVFIGGTAVLNKEELLSGAGPNLLLKTKKDRIYSAGAIFGTNGVISVQGGLHWKLSF
jgi:uncharacterized protein YaiE (UPF0345 family)